MNAVLARRTAEVKTAAPPRRGELRIVPISGPSADRPPYRVLDSAALNLVNITEVSEAGIVPEVLVINSGDQMLFLMDGQELVGAKQNRILNTDVLAPAGKKLRIPVSCVEARSWKYRSKTFSPGKSASHRTRSAKQQRVYHSLVECNRHDADQIAVWDEVEDVLSCSDAADSPYRALADGYARRQTELDEFRRDLDVPADAVGLAVLREDKLLGIDLFDRHSTLAHFWPTLIDSYAIEFLRGGRAQPAPVREHAGARDTALVDEALRMAAARDWERFDAPGIGADWRLGRGPLAGSALVWEDEVIIHLQLFPAGQELVY